MSSSGRDLIRDLAVATINALTKDGSALRSKRRSTAKSKSKPRPTPKPKPRAKSKPKPTAKPRGKTPASPPLSDAYPGDFTARATVTYSPDPDGEPDPGEVVWTWVPYEEDFTQGKDRPVLLVARDGDWLLGLMLTSQDHDRDAADEAQWGRYWIDVGSGAWDSKGRPSEARLDRILRVNPDSVRREGAVLKRKIFDQVKKALAVTNGW